MEMHLMEAVSPVQPETQPQVAEAQRRQLPALWSWLLPGLVSGVLLWMCYFPLAVGWLAWIALVPLLSLVRLPLSRKKIFLAAFAAGLWFFVPALSWMRVADYRMYATWLMLAVYCSCYFPV